MKIPFLVTLLIFLLPSLGLAQVPASWVPTCPHSENGDVSVFWWNIRFGSLNSSALNQNLEAIATDSCAPDVIALAEYEPTTSLSPAVEGTLEHRYAFHRFFPYSLTIRHRGIRVYSKLPVAEVDAEAPLAWQPFRRDLTSRYVMRFEANARYGSQEVNYFDRTLIRLVLETPRGPLALVPTHLLQPFAPLAKKRGALFAAYDLLFSSNNPMGFQISSTLRALRARYGAHLDKNEGFVFFGDLNFPASVGLAGTPRLTTPHYVRLLQAGLRDAFTERDDAPTFPTEEAPEAQRLLYQLNPLHLDHVFTSARATATQPEIPHLLGSDHSPLFFIARVVESAPE